MSGWVYARVQPGVAHQKGDWGRQRGHKALNLAESWGKNIPGRGHSRSRGLRQEAAHSVQGRGAMTLELGECRKALVTEVEQGDISAQGGRMCCQPYLSLVFISWARLIFSSALAITIVAIVEVVPAYKSKRFQKERKKILR